MQSTFSVPNGSVPGWTSALQLQQVVQPTQAIHATQIRPACQPNQTQVMVVHPTNHGQHQLHMSQVGWTDPRLNTARMMKACQTWKSEKKVQNDADRCRWQQEKAILQQQYQLLHSEYQAALVHIQNLALQHGELDKKLKMDQCKYQELNKTYVISMQREQNKYNALNNMYNETCIQLRNEKGKCNALNIKLEESARKLSNEQLKYKVLNRIHAETKKILHSARQKGDDVAKFIESKNKSSGDQDQYKTLSLNSSSEQPVMSSLKDEPYMEHVPVRVDGSQSSSHDPMKAEGEYAFCERSKHLVVPPGFERSSSTSASGPGAGNVE